MIPADLVWGFPEGVYFLLVLPFIVMAMLWLDSYQQKAKQVFGKMSIPRSRVNHWIRNGFICLCWVFAVFALMDPKGGVRFPIKKKQLEAQRFDLLLLVDASASMRVDDTRSGVQRFEFAKEIADQIVYALGAENVALWAFTSDVTQLSPFTYDQFFVRLMLRHMQINEGDIGGTDLVKALQMAISKTENRDKQTVIVILSDGGQTETNAFNFKPGSDQLIVTIGLGSQKGGVVPDVEDSGKPVVSVLEDHLLKQIGAYFLANEWTVKELAEQLSQLIDQQLDFTKEPDASDKAVVVYDQYFQYPLGLAIFFLSLAIFLPTSTYKKPHLVALACLTIFSVEGSERKAKVFDEAAEFNKATEVYQNILDKPLNPWQKVYTLYNLGVLEQKKNNPQKARVYYSQIDHLDHQMPQLSYHLKKNLALLRYKSASISCSERLSSLKEALKDLKEAEIADCIFKKALGFSDCFASQDLKNLKTEIKQALDLAISDCQKEKWESILVDEGAVRLLLSVQEALDDLAFLEGKPMSEMLKGRYHTVFLKKINGWLPLWGQMFRKNPSLKPAKQEFQQGIAFLKEDLLEQSQNAFALAKQKLEVWIEKLFEKHPILQLYQTLLTLIDRTLNQRPVQRIFLWQIDTQFKTIEEIEKSSSSDQIKYFLKKSFEFVKKGQDNQALFFLHLVKIQVRQLIWEKEKSSGMIEILEKAIQMQGDTIDLNHLAYRIEKKEKLNDFLIDAQKQTVALADRFIPALLKEQKEAFKQRCQKRPFDQAIPLFDQGLLAANQAVDYLEKTKNLLLAVQKQQQAHSLWREVLERLKNPKPEQTEKEQMVTDQEVSIDQVFKQLQKMNLDDQEKTAPSAAGQGVKAW